MYGTALAACTALHRLHVRHCIGCMYGTASATCTALHWLHVRADVAVHHNHNLGITNYSQLKCTDDLVRRFKINRTDSAVVWNFKLLPAPYFRHRCHTRTSIITVMRSNRTSQHNMTCAILCQQRVQQGVHVMGMSWVCHGCPKTP